MKHKFKSIDGAAKRVRHLETLLAWYEEHSRELKAQRNLMAKLAAKEPQFFNPLEAMAAETLRDKILATI